MIVQLSAGQGPEECQIAVGRLYYSLKKEYSDLEMISCREGRIKDAYYSILFFTEHDLSELEGTILWICKSPLRPGHKRKNWYVDVSIIPEKEEVADSADYRIEKFRCGGKGGQNVNKVETGVRVTHIPTGITVISTEERSQYLNKQKVLKRIRAVLDTMKQEASAKQVSQAWREHTKIVRGNPVRVYEGGEKQQTYKSTKNYCRNNHIQL
ncbi:MAG: peptide chain release factor H [Lachnospiraceae bacterium]|nr:peptide chain release factor H [Lachnospiraceae bacterium]